jgi:hypothetical protein
MGSLAGRRPDLCLVRAPARSIRALASDRAGGKRTYAESCSSAARSPYMTAVKASMLEPLVGDSTVRSAIAVADPGPR